MTFATDAHARCCSRHFLFRPVVPNIAECLRLEREAEAVQEISEASSALTSADMLNDFYTDCATDALALLRMLSFC